MSHLTVEQIIKFVSINELTSETIELASFVNTHIRSCQLCREKVAAFQNVYEELCRLENARVAKERLYTLVSDDRLEIIKREDLERIFKQNGEDIAASWGD